MRAIKEVKELLRKYGYKIYDEKMFINQAHIPWWEGYTDMPAYRVKKLTMPLEEKEGKRIADIDVYLMPYGIKISRYKRGNA